MAKSDGRRFTPGQQAVAEALMEVIQRAMMGHGRETALAAKQLLVSNNPAAQSFLAMLPDDGPLPSLQHVEEQASKHLFKSLAKLAKQLEAARCQPLEVFTRSVQCTTHKTAMLSLAAKGRMYEKQQRMQQLDQTMARHKRRLTSEGPAMECLQALEQMGLSAALVALTLTFMQTYRLLRDKEYWDEPATAHRSDLDHLLPGRLQCWRLLVGSIQCTEALHLFKMQDAIDTWPQMLRTRSDIPDFAVVGQSSAGAVHFEAAHSCSLYIQ